MENANKSLATLQTWNNTIKSDLRISCQKLWNYQKRQSEIDICLLLLKINLSKTQYI